MRVEGPSTLKQSCLVVQALVPWYPETSPVLSPPRCCRPRKGMLLPWHDALGHRVQSGKLVGPRL